MKWQLTLAAGAMSFALIPPALAVPGPASNATSVGPVVAIQLADANQQQNEGEKGRGGQRPAPQRQAPPQRGPQPQRVTPPPQRGPQPQRTMPQPQERRGMPQPQRGQQPQRVTPPPQRTMPQPQRTMPQPQRTMPQPQERRGMPQPQRVTPQPQRTMPQSQRGTPQRNPRYNWGQYRPGQRPPDWQAHRNFDRAPWQRNFNAERRFRWQPYQRPPGWYARRWAFGMILPSLFWTQPYWITDYGQFGLADPPYGYVWVRDGDDALLVDVQSGYILQVIYGLFD
jgi:Ni/Co efflux regulator RcnB